MPLPLLPRNIKDPTGQDSRERKAIDDFERRLKAIRKGALDILAKNKPTVVTMNSLVINQTFYEFNLSTEALAMMSTDIDNLVDRLLLEGGAAQLWFMVAYVSPAYQQGTGQAHTNLSLQSGTYKMSRPTLMDVLNSDPYRRRLGYVRAREFEEMKGFSADVKKQLSTTLMDGMAQGLNPLTIAENITTATGADITRSRRIARTEITTALRRARLDEAEDAVLRVGLNIRMMQISALSATTRASHAGRHAQLFTIEQVRVWMSTSPNMINCYLPGARVRGRFVAGSKARYKGPAIRIVTAGGNDLSVTTNHRVMSSRGLIAAAELREGDYLVSYRNEVEAPRGIADLDGKLVHARIEDVYGSLAQLGETRSRRVRAVDFHGDGVFIKEDVDVVSVNRPLTTGCESALGECLDYLKLVHSNSAPLKSYRSADQGGVAVYGSASCLVRGLRLVSSFIRRHLGGFHKGGARLPPVREAEPVEPAVYIDSARTSSLADSKDRFASEVRGMHESGASLVELDVISSVERFAYHGFVYDLEEKSGLMVANNIVASNCKCSFTEILVDAKGKPETPKIIQLAEDMIPEDRVFTKG